MAPGPRAFTRIPYGFEFQSHDAGHVDDCRLGDTVAEVTRLDLYTNPRGYVDYRSARPHRHHVTSHRLRHEKRAPDHDFVVIVENVRSL